MLTCWCRFEGGGKGEVMAVLSCLEVVWVSEDKVHEVEVRGGQFQVEEVMRSGSRAVCVAAN
jgi:hypothetical protein